MKLRPKFLYFDIDDTLLDHKGAEKAALADTRALFPFLAHVDLEQLQQVYHHNNLRLWKDYGAGNIERSYLEVNRFAWTLRDLGLDPDLADTVRTVYMQQYANHWAWVPGAKEALSDLTKWYPVGFLTNGFAEVQHAKSRQFNLDAYSFIYLISEEVGFMKPQPGIFAHATREAGVQPHEILYVGDSFDSDIAGGSAFGWKTAWFTPQADPMRRSRASFVFHDFSELVRTLDPDFS